MSRTILMLLTLGCAPPAATPCDNCAPPPQLDHPQVLLAGRTATLTVQGAPPGAQVTVVAGNPRGGAPLCPPQTAPACLQVAGPISPLASNIAWPTGAAPLTFRVPAAATGTLPLQIVLRRGGSAQPSTLVQLPVLAPTADDDGDGLSNEAEVVGGTDPLRADTDGDALLDAAELRLGANPHQPDTDRDGALDGAEGAQDVLRAPAPTTGVRVHLQRLAPGGRLSFGLPVPPGAVTTSDQVSVTLDGAPIPATITETLPELDATGARVGVRALRIELNPSVMTGDTLDLEVRWRGQNPQGGPPTSPYVDATFRSPERASTAIRDIRQRAGQHELIETARAELTLYEGAEPMALATFPRGYVAGTGLLGELTSADEAAGLHPGLAFISEAARGFTRSAMNLESYALHPAGVAALGTDPEPWLYDRCATFLETWAHGDDVDALRHGLRACSFYASQIGLSGANRGLFLLSGPQGRIYANTKGLYAYYALTGDELARDAIEAIAAGWLNDTSFVVPYRQGHTRGPTHMWTERNLGKSMEALYYGFATTADPRYFRALSDLVATAHEHITGDATVLATLNPGVPFPPQGCWIHSAQQADEGAPDEPWCSGWMIALTVDPLLRYGALTGDTRVDEIFLQLARSLRDHGTSWVGLPQCGGEVLGGSFLQPPVCYEEVDGVASRRLIPSYGYGVDAHGTLQNYGLEDDVQHCIDATAVTAAGLRSLQRSGAFNLHPIGPFPDEGASLTQLHHELAACAELEFQLQTRPNRAPEAWTSDELRDALAAAGTAEAAILDNKIGFPQHNLSPSRRLSWWFNPSLLQFDLLRDAGVQVQALQPGVIRPCP